MKAAACTVCRGLHEPQIDPDLRMPIKQGIDPNLAMSSVNVIVVENPFEPAFMKEQTDLPALVRTGLEVTVAGGAPFFLERSLQRA